MPDDAVYVFCNMTVEGETCVFPDVRSSKIINIPWRRSARDDAWFSDLRGGFTVRAALAVAKRRQTVNSFKGSFS